MATTSRIACLLDLLELGHWVAAALGFLARRDSKAGSADQAAPHGRRGREAFVPAWQPWS